MPAGVSWGAYLRLVAASLVSMFAGAQLVHAYYKPLTDLDRYVEEERARRNASESQNKDV
ncbi:ubiquinol-cytochrome-c reductase complex assembly factor 6 [Cylas formicarius]|uniref:ubiquinol-cytochrome-c reductase complex assembly factor 6 n=1 Tax=Cylas formicarius TaxID=197179 RepID=UPI002958D49E|nr:ubiquinol-cytochrome-c reductase complex assembly factor 6 [Cylas formicarius]